MKKDEMDRVCGHTWVKVKVVPVLNLVPCYEDIFVA
jgi:hypothetical protein